MKNIYGMYVLLYIAVFVDYFELFTKYIYAHLPC